MEYIFLVLRTGLIFLLIMIIIRILGKREVGELSIFDLVVLLIVANIGSISIENKELLVHSIIGLVSIFIFQKLLTYLLVKIPRLRSFSDGNPRIIIFNGNIDFKAMKKEMYTMDDLITQIRYFKIMDISEIKLAILETNGVLSVFRKSNYEFITLPIILSGVFERDALVNLGLNAESILVILDSQGIILSDVILASSDGKTMSVYVFDRLCKTVKDPEKMNLLRDSLDNEVKDLRLRS